MGCVQEACPDLREACRCQVTNTSVTGIGDRYNRNGALPARSLPRWLGYVDWEQTSAEFSPSKGPHCRARAQEHGTWKKANL